jgi:hypothetical protein
MLCKLTTLNPIARKKKTTTFYRKQAKDMQARQESRNFQLKKSS